MKYNKYSDLIIAISLKRFYDIMPRTSISEYNRNLNTSFNDWVKRTNTYLNKPIPESFKNILDDNEDCINLGYCFITLMDLYHESYNKYYKDNNNLRNTVEIRNFKNNIREHIINLSEYNFLLDYKVFYNNFYKCYGRYHFDIDESKRKEYFNLIQFLFENIKYYKIMELKCKKQ